MECMGRQFYEILFCTPTITLYRLPVPHQHAVERRPERVPVFRQAGSRRYDPQQHARREQRVQKRPAEHLLSVAPNNKRAQQHETGHEEWRAAAVTGGGEGQYWEIQAGLVKGGGHHTGSAEQHSDSGTPSAQQRGRLTALPTALPKALPTALPKALPTALPKALPPGSATGLAHLVQQRGGEAPPLAGAQVEQRRPAEDDGRPEERPDWGGRECEGGCMTS